MSQTGATFEQSLGMLTAITEVTRNASKASRGLVSIGSRLTQIVDDTSSTGKALKEVYESLGIALFDSEGQLRSSYDIFYDLAQIWNTLDKNTQNYIASQQASTNQFQNFAALMSNFSHAVEATSIAMDSANSAFEENTKYMEGLEAKTQGVQATYEKLANTVVDSDLVKIVLDLSKGFLELADSGIGKFIIQSTVVGGVLWGGSGLIAAMKILPNLTSKTGIAIGVAGKVLALGAPQLFAIASGITLLLTLIPKISKWVKSFSQDSEILSQELSNTETQLSKNKERLQELNNIPYYNRTRAIEDEIYALEKENEELEKKLKLTKEDLGLSQTSDLRQDKKYLVKDTALHITSDFYDQTFSNLERAIANLKDQSILPEDWEGDLNKLKETLESLGYEVAEQEGNYASFEDSVQSLVEEYQELYNKQQQGRLNNVEEQQRLVELTGLLSSFINEVNNLEGGLDNLTDGEKEAYLTAVDLQEGFEDVKEATYAMGEEVSGSARLFNDLLAGMQLTNEQKDILIKKYPKLNELIEQGTNGWQLQSEALNILIGSEEQWAKSAITSTKAVLNAQIKYAQASYRSAIELAKTLRLSGDEEAYKKQKASAEDLYRYYNDLVGLQKEIAFQEKYSKPTKKTVVNDFGGSGGNGSNSGSSISKTTDKLKEQNDLFKERIDILNHELFLLEKSGASDSQRIDKLKQIQQELHKQAEWFRSQGLGDNSEYIRELQEQWWNYQDTIINIYETIEQKAKEANEKMLEAQKQALEKQSKLFEDVYNYYNEEAEAYEALADYMQDRIDEEINLIQNKIDALDKENEEIENQIALEEKLDALARAKASKVMVYKDGSFQYVEDVDAVSSAAKDLEDFNREQELAVKKEALQNEIDILNKYKDEWANLTNAYNKEQNRRLILEKLGIEIEKINFSSMLTNAQDFAEKYAESMKKATEAYEKFLQAQEAANKIGQSTTSSSSNSNIGNTVGNVIGNIIGMGSIGNVIGNVIGKAISKGTPKYANGSINTSAGMSLVGENGPELRILSQGDGIIPNDITKNLWAWGATTPSTMMNSMLNKFQTGGQQIGITIQNFTPNLPNVTDGESFANYMRNNFWREAIQFAKT